MAHLTEIGTSSSAGGKGSGSKVHTPYFHNLKTDRIRITEGELKADLATSISGTPTLSIPGVGSWKLILPELDQYNPKEVLVALDADYQTNPHVALALFRLVRALKSKEIEVKIEDFILDPSKGIKGIDDALAANASISLIEGDALDDLLTQLQVRYNFEDEIENLAGDVDPKSETAADLCDKFMKSRGLINTDGVPLLRYWNDRLYRYNGSVYKRLSKSEVTDEIIVFFRNIPRLRHLATPRTADDVYANVRAMVRIGQFGDSSVFLDDIVNSGRMLIPLKNGMLDLTETLKASSPPILLEHDPKIINFHCLPYEFNPTAKCPRWEKIMRDFFGDEEDTIKLIQEWFGYLLVPDTSYEAMMMLLGDGSNGKSIMINAMGELLGQENYSAVALEQIRADRTFTLVPMIGKLANIVGEVSEVCKPAQDILKSLVSGDPIAVDEKYDTVMPAVKFYARLVLSSNNPPRFTDRSDGIWRRLITVPFTRQFSEEEKDLSLKAPNYWRESGELEGLFIWALEGLIRLKKNGKFTQSNRVDAEKTRYHSECNPAKEFIRCHCEGWSKEAGIFDKRFYTAQPDLYEAYRNDALGNGNQPLSAQQFAKEVLRMFPKVKKGDNPESFEGKKVRLWKGIRFHREGFNPEERTKGPEAILFNDPYDNHWYSNEPLASL